jgi:hypothetical protein
MSNGTGFRDQKLPSAPNTRQAGMQSRSGVERLGLEKDGQDRDGAEGGNGNVNER